MAQRSRIHEKHVHSLIWREGPEGLYPFPLLWMEGEQDLEGFHASVSYAYIKECCSFHPVEGMVVHPYDEIMVFVSTNLDAMQDLGAEVTITIGEEQEQYSFNHSTVVCIPKGVPHGPATVTSLDKAFVQYTVGLDTAYAGEMIAPGQLGEPVPGKKYADLVKPFRWWVDPVTGMRIQDKYSDPAWWENHDENDPGYGQIARWYKDAAEYKAISDGNLDCFGVSHPSNRGDKGPGNAKNLIWMFGKQLNGFNLNTAFGHFTSPGILHKAGESHSHVNEEILVFLSLDPDDPLYLGARCEIALGEEDERYAVEVPTAFMIPRGLTHLPQTCLWLDRPYVFMVIELDAEHESPWKVRDGSLNKYEAEDQAGE